MLPGQSLAKAHNKLEPIVVQLRPQQPQLVRRLANCFYWAILTSSPKDVQRHKQIFGAAGRRS